jgi:hypothetical protein
MIPTRIQEEFHIFSEPPIEPAPQKVWYLAGPMRGFPQCNFPAFIAAADKLRAAGHTIISPAEMDSPETRKEAMQCVGGEDLKTYGGETTGSILARDVRIVADDVTGIVFLPGWSHSRGARLEAFVALLYDKELAVFFPEGWTDMRPVSKDVIRKLLKENMP